MRTVSLCVYCSRIAVRTCTGCGMPVCEAHFSAAAPTLCMQCAHGRVGRTGAAEAPIEGVSFDPLHHSERRDETE